MAGQITCIGFSCRVLLLHRKDDKNGEDGNGSLGDRADAQEMVLTDVSLNGIQHVN